MTEAPAPRALVPKSAQRHRAAQLVVIAVVLGLPLGGCSFDLGSWGSDDKPKPAATPDKPAADAVTPQDVSTAKDHVTRGQVLAHSGKLDEAMTEFEQALTADPYNIQALYGRALIYQGRGQHQQAIDDFTAASRLAPQATKKLIRQRTRFAMWKSIAVAKPSARTRESSTMSESGITSCMSTTRNEPTQQRPR